MPVTSVTTDAEALTVTVVAEFPAPVERLWDAVADPRKLERFWGPPGYPATFTDFDLRPGGRARYRMTSPEGESHHVVWEFVEVDELRSITLRDLFATEDGEIDDDMPPSVTQLGFDATDGGSRLTIVSTFESTEGLEAMLAMGMAEGYREAVDQLDVVLADLRAYALGKGVQVEVLDDTHVRFTRGFAAPRSLIWRAHTDPDLLKRWMLGPEGWSIAEYRNDLTPGGSYLTRWVPGEGVEGEPFGFEGENLVIEPERRMVSTERMIGVPTQTINDLTLDEADGVTLLTLYITYPDAETRDMILATGMTDGMEASYARLEREVAGD